MIAAARVGIAAIGRARWIVLVAALALLAGQPAEGHRGKLRVLIRNGYMPDWSR